MTRLEQLLTEIRACRFCEAHLPLGPRPVLSAGKGAVILIAGQAPGTRVHATGIPWNDPSGDRLRNWLMIGKDVFYDESRIAIVPMGFCYPGKGKSGDLPPRPECAVLWHQRLLAELSSVKLTLAIGQYSTDYYLGQKKKKNLTDTVRNWENYHKEGVIPLPHPSPRNLLWLKKNPWFEEELLPVIRKEVWKLLGRS
ncbi:MAG: uracil-DNA glycosylase family protein [Bacteroidia bacterium]|nr:uracil-DNA glycosylase family protein [Bacteroidia bacterium]